MATILRQTALLLFTWLSLAQGQGPGSDQVCLLVPSDVNDCYSSFQNKPISSTAAQVACLQKLLWNYVPDNSLSPEEYEIMNGMFRNMQRNAANRSGSGPGGAAAFSTSGFRLRSEYRTLSDDQRNRFHAAMNRLYQNGTIRMFARLHASAGDQHHGGPSFLPWHRILLVMFEEFLRSVDPTVALPYLDTTIDYDMGNPVNSIIWSERYLGNGAGPVTSGPFAGWVTDQGNLERNYGRRSRLFRKEDIRNVLTRCRLAEISRPTAQRPYDFELFHGGVHLWIGGEMSSLRTAAWDPVFYLHHAYVDYVWEVFRRRQVEVCGVDPTTDYPNVPPGNHAPDEPIVGFPEYTNRDGISAVWTRDFYNYNPTPSCPDCCPGCSFPQPMYCDRFRNVCVATSRRPFRFNATDTPAMTFSRTLALREDFLSQSENDALENEVAARNRGHEFDGPASDGRTLETAMFDAMNAARNGQGSSGPRSQSSRRSRGRGSRGRPSQRHRGRAFDGPPADRSSSGFDPAAWLMNAPPQSWSSRSSSSGQRRVPRPGQAPMRTGSLSRRRVIDLRPGGGRSSTGRFGQSRPMGFSTRDSRISRFGGRTDRWF